MLLQPKKKKRKILAHCTGSATRLLKLVNLLVVLDILGVNMIHLTPAQRELHWRLWKGSFTATAVESITPIRRIAYCLPCTNSLQMFIGFWCLSISTGLSELLDRPICSWLLRDELGLIPCFLLTRRARSFWEDGNLMNLLKGECMPLWDPGLSCNADMFIWLFVYVLSKQKLFPIASSSFGYVSSQADIA